MKNISKVHRHAEYRMCQREITLTEAERVLNEWHTNYPSERFPGHEVFIGEAAGRLIKIYVRPLEDGTYELRTVVAPKE